MKGSFGKIIVLALVCIGISAVAHSRTVVSTYDGVKLIHDQHNVLVFEGKVQRRVAGVEGSFKLVLTNDSPVFIDGQSIMTITINDATADFIRTMATYTYRLPINPEMGTYPLSDEVIIVKAVIGDFEKDKDLPDFIFKSFRKK